MAAAPYIIAAIGTYASLQAQQDAADERRQILNTQLEASDAASKKTNALVLENAQNTYDPNQRQSNLEAKADEISAQQQKDLQTGAGGGAVGAPDTAGDAGNLSDDFLRAKADKAVTEGNRLTSLARQIAKTRAVGGLLQDEGKKGADLASELQNIQSANQSSYRGAVTDAGSVGTSPLGALGSLAGSIGAGMAANGTWGTPSTLGSGVTATNSGLGFTGSGSTGVKVPSGINWGTY